MIKIEGHGVPTKFKPAERGTVYTDLDTGKRYKCLGKKGFVNQDAVNEPVEYHWQLVDMVDESEMPEGSGGGAISWNDIPDKPFYEEKVHEPITWDGNTEGLESANTGMMIWCYKMAEDYSYLEPTDFIGATFKNPDVNDLVTITEDHISDDGLSVVVVVGGYVVFAFIKEGGTAQYIGDNAGLWLCKNSGGRYTDVVSFSTTIKTIDPKFLPEITPKINWGDINNRPFGYTTNAKYNLLEGNDLLCRFDKLVLPEGATSDRTTSPNYGTITMPFSVDAYTTHITYIDGGGTIHTDPLEFEIDDTGRIGTASWYSYPATIKLEYDENWSNCTLTLVIPTYMSGECSAMPLYISDMYLDPIPVEYVQPKNLYINPDDDYIYVNPIDNKRANINDVYYGNCIIYTDWSRASNFTTMFSVVSHDDGYAIVKAIEIQDDGSSKTYVAYTKEFADIKEE